MSRVAGILLTLVLAAALVGCQGGESIRAGRAALAADKPVEAARHFENALRHRPSLAHNERFQAEVMRARRGAAMERGREFLASRRPQQAVTQFEKALEVDPGYAPAVRALSEAHGAAAEAGYRAAALAADGGDLTQARSLLNEALSHAPEHAGAVRALRLLDDPTAAQPRAGSLFREAGALADVKDWDRAAGMLREAVASDPDLLVARARLAEAMRNIGAAEEKLAAGQRALEAKRLDEALQFTSDAAALRPHHTPTAAALTLAQQRRAEAEDAVAEAAQRGEAGDYAAALQAAERARVMYPDHPRLELIEAGIRDRAAARYAAEGRSHMTAARSADAESAFREAMRFRADYAPAREGLAALADARAHAAAGEGWWGSALLYHLDAVELEQTPVRKQAVDRAWDQVARRAGAAVVFQRSRMQGAAADEFEDQVIHAMGSMRTSVIRLLDRGDAEEPHYIVIPGLSRLEVYTRVAHESQRDHPYRVERPIPNPEIPRLRDAVWQARGQVHRAWRDVEDRRDAYHRARDHADRHSQSERADQKLDNRKAELDAAKSDLSRAEHELRRVEHELAVASPVALEVSEARWPYVEQTYRMIGSLAAEVRLVEGEGGGELPGAPIEAHFEESDTTIQGANPSLGLHADPLQLPSESAVQAQLVREGAEKAAAAAVTRILEARLRAAQDRAREAAGKGDPALALEAEVDAAVILEARQRGAGVRRLAELRQETAGP